MFVPVTIVNGKDSDGNIICYHWGMRGSFVIFFSESGLRRDFLSSFASSGQNVKGNLQMGIYKTKAFKPPLDLAICTLPSDFKLHNLESSIMLSFSFFQLNWSLSRSLS